MRTAPLQGRLLAVAAFILALRENAHAHTTVPGTSDFMGGVLHPVMTPAHALILLGLGLALGQHLPFRPALVLRVFAPAAALALALTTRLTFTVPQPVLVCIALCAGAVVALGRPLPPPVRTVLFATGALAMGLDSGVETGGITTVIRTLLGTLAGLTIFVFIIAFYTAIAAEQKRKWLDIAVRVAGSWIAAISLLMLAFALRK